jgi:hypothetical protein
MLMIPPPSSGITRGESAAITANLGGVAARVLQKFAEMHNGNRRLAPAFAKVTIGWAAVAPRRSWRCGCGGVAVQAVLGGALPLPAGTGDSGSGSMRYGSNPCVATMTVLRRQAVCSRQFVSPQRGWRCSGSPVIRLARTTLRAFVRAPLPQFQPHHDLPDCAPRRPTAERATDPVGALRAWHSRPC